MTDKIKIKEFQDWGEEEVAYVLLGMYTTLALQGILVTGKEGESPLGLHMISVVTDNSNGEQEVERLTGERRKEVSSFVVAINKLLMEVAKEAMVDSGVTEHTDMDSPDEVGARSFRFGNYLVDLLMNKVAPRLDQQLREDGFPIDKIEEEATGNSWQAWKKG